jgi:SAM-dependent methyltransferase
MENHAVTLAQANLIAAQLREQEAEKALGNSRFARGKAQRELSEARSATAAARLAFEQAKHGEDRLSALIAELEATRLERDRYFRWANGFVDFTEGPAKSNVDNWKNLQDKGYFENHPNHQGLAEFSSGEVEVIEHFKKLDKSQNVVVIGCGYGREAALISPRVKHIYGIDVSDSILKKAVGYLSERGVQNFSPVLVDSYADAIPNGIDLIFCFVVFQHLTRDLTRSYLDTLGKRLSPDGVFVLQFLETTVENETLLDASLEDYEPSVSWSVMQIHRLAWLCGLATVEIKTVPVSGGAALWHWASLKRKD